MQLDWSYFFQWIDSGLNKTCPGDISWRYLDNSNRPHMLKQIRAELAIREGDFLIFYFFLLQGPPSTYTQFVSLGVARKFMIMRNALTPSSPKWWAFGADLIPSPFPNYRVSLLLVISFLFFTLTPFSARLISIRSKFRAAHGGKWRGQGGSLFSGSRDEIIDVQGRIKKNGTPYPFGLFMVTCTKVFARHCAIYSSISAWDGSLHVFFYN